MAAAAPAFNFLPLASVDTQQRLPYTPHRTYPKNNKLSSSSSVPIPNTVNRNQISVSDLLSRSRFPNPTHQQPGKSKEETYMGYETWLPSPPKVEKPRSMYNAASLAYIGDCIYELYARRHFLFPPLHIEEYNDRVMAVVRCEAQDAMLQKLLDDNFLSEEERNVLRWGKNTGSAKNRTKKRAGVAAYSRASSLETLVGFLYLTNVNRLEEVMVKLGFLAGASTQLILEEANGHKEKAL